MTSDCDMKHSNKRTFPVDLCFSHEFHGVLFCQVLLDIVISFFNENTEGTLGF